MVLKPSDKWGYFPLTKEFLQAPIDDMVIYSVRPRGIIRENIIILMPQIWILFSFSTDNL